MPRKAFFILTVLFLSGCASLTPAPEDKPNVDKLSPEHIARVQALVAKLEPFVQKKDEEGKLPSLTFKQLESSLNPEQIRLLRAFKDLRAGEVGVTIPFRGFSQGETKLTKIYRQKILLDGKEKILPPQFLSLKVFKAFQFMMSAMESDTGKRLFVESGYRSSAHQLYLFIFFLSNHDYSIRETAKWVALPGYSEHGDPEHQAIDFINAEGINGEQNPTEFEALTEYRWLLKNAGRFGFVLSYPKNAGAGITFEPWHWRYDGVPKS